MLDTLISPKVVAVVGASSKEGKVGHAVLSNLVSSGYAGRIIPVNPHESEILGLPVFKDIREAGGSPPDLTLVVVPSESVLKTVKQAIEAGTRSIAIITSGFREGGAEGLKAEEAIAAVCKQARVRLLGPNCLGLINTSISMNASFAPQMPLPGGISIISQSGALCTAILDWARAHGVGLAKLISVGNKADVDESDLLAMLAEDPDTKVIACYLEAISNGDEFIKVAEQAAQMKPVVVLKSGTTAAGARAASSHTGSLVGVDMAYGAAFKRAGVIRAENFEALYDYSMAFAMQPLPKGNRVAIITNAGGPGIVAADAVEQQGLSVTMLTPAIEADLAAKLPPMAHAGNPIDVLGDAGPSRYVDALDACLSDEAVEAIIIVLTPQAMSHPVETANACIELIQSRREAHADAIKPVLVSFMGGREIKPACKAFVAAGIPDYFSPERAAQALRAMNDYSAWLRRPPRIVTRFPVNRHRAERILRRHARTGRREIGEVDAKGILKAYDFHVLPGQLARSAEEAVLVADHVGYPVAMKVVSPDIVHKSDLGGVRLRLSTPEQVRDAYDLMMLRISQRQPDAELIGTYIERMAEPGREVILGMARDPQFGPMLMFGLGGIFVEVMKDVSFHLAPITESEALQMLKGTRSYALLQGARGEMAVDLHAIAGGLQRLSQLATDFPEIEEMDINPFIVGQVGTPPVVADARMTIALNGKKYV